MVETIFQAGASHIGSNLSCADIISVLFGTILKFDASQPEWPDRDRFILSKGHAAVVMYSVLAEMGYIPGDALTQYSKNGSTLLGHISHHVPGVELSTGSLGHGLPVGIGMALAAKADKKPHRTYILLSDGEMDEGSNWEAILFAGFHKLSNLIAIIDYNKIQSYGSVKDVLDLEPLAQKLSNFNWQTYEVDGHDITGLRQTFSQLSTKDSKPTAVICHTVKGKGISFMENNLAWHYQNPTGDQYAAAILELSAK
ncbi:MAG: transketolase [Turneriella sp.]|nr:transketolase [Turneriella sp.]